MGSNSRRWLNQSTPPSHLHLVKAVNGLGESIIAAVSHVTHRGLDTSFYQTLGVFDRDVLTAAAPVMDESAAMDRPPVMQGLLESSQHEARMHRPRKLPADDVTGVGINDAGDIDEPCLCPYISEARDPQRIWPGHLEPPVHMIQHRPHRPGTNLGGILVRRLAHHRSTFSEDGASNKPRAVQTLTSHSGDASSQCFASGAWGRCRNLPPCMAPSIVTSTNSIN